MLSVKCVVAVAVATAVAGCGAGVPSAPPSESQAAMLHTMIAAKDQDQQRQPTPTTSAAGPTVDNNDPANVKFVQALEGMSLRLQPPQEVVLGRLVCAGLKQTANPTMAGLVAAVESNTARAVSPDQAVVIVTTAIQVYCPENSAPA